MGGSVRKVAAIALAGLVLFGCDGLFRGRREGVIPPDQESSAWPRTERPGPANPSPQPPPASPDPARTAATAPYRIVSPPQVLEAAVLQVNHSFITVPQVLHPIRQRLQALTAASGGEEVRFRPAAQAMIAEETANQLERVLLLAEADRRLSEEQRKAIDEEVNKIYRKAVAQSGGIKTAFVALLRQEGTDLETWHRDLWSALAIQSYVQQQFASRIHVTRGMMWKHYQANAERFRTEERVQMQIIAAPFESFVAKDGPGGEQGRREAVTQAQEQMAEAWEALRRGTDFGEVAAKYSRGPMASANGVWPMMARNSFRAAAVEQAAFAQEVGQVSKLITTPEGLYIVKTLTRRRGQQVSFEKVQEQIEKELRLQQLDGLRREYLTELRSKATVVGAEHFWQVAVNTAVRMYLQP